MSKKQKIESGNLNDQDLTSFYLDALFQVLKKLFVVVFNSTTVSVVNDAIININNRKFIEN